LFVVVSDGSLMYKYIFFGIISIDKSVPISDVEPFDNTRNSFFQNFFLGSGSVSSSSGSSYGRGAFFGVAGLILGFNLGFDFFFDSSVFDGSFS